MECSEKTSWHSVTPSVVNVIIGIECLVHFHSHREGYLVENSRWLGVGKR